MKKLAGLIFTVLFPALLGLGQGSGFRISGKITGDDGRALAGATVSLAGSNTGVTADAGGFYTIVGLSAGDHILAFSFIGFETRIERIKVTGDIALDIVLQVKTIQTGDVLVSATRAGEKTPLAYSSVSAAQLKKQNVAYDMPFLLSLTPSFVETSEAGNGIGYTGMRVRGTDGNRINVTIDGIPLNDAESQQVFWVDLPDLASSVDNIQVQRGAGTSSNGSGAFGATISLQTADPETEPFAEVSSSAGSFRTLKNSVSAGTGMLGGVFGLRMRYSDIKSDGYIDRTGSDHRSESVSGIFRTGKTVIKANVILGEEHTGIGWWGVPAEMLSKNRRYNPAGEYTDSTGAVRYYANESDNYKQDHFQLIFSRKLSDLLSVHAAAHYTKGRGYYEEYREDQSYSDYGLNNVTVADQVIGSTDLVRRKWLSNDFYGLVWSLRYKNERLEATAGGGMNRYDGDHFGRIIWMQYAGSVPKDYQWYFNDARKGEFSIYGKVSYQLAERLNMFGDLQYRNLNYRMQGIDDDLKDLGQEHHFGFINPKAGLFWSINHFQDAYISFSVANREPTREDFKEASGDPSATPRPETLYDTELGYSLRTGKLSAGLNLYAMIYDDQLIPTGELSDVGYSIMTNVKKSYRMGIELTAGYKPVTFIDWNANLTLSRNKIMGFTEYYTDYNTANWSSEYRSEFLGTTDLAYSPSVIATSDLGFRIGGSTGLHLISKYVGRQFVDNTMSENRKVDPYFVNNIRIDFEPSLRQIRGLTLQLLVNNIFNTMYISNGYGGNWYEDGLEKSWSYYFPQAGTNFIVRAALKF